MQLTYMFMGSMYEMQIMYLYIDHNEEANDVADVSVYRRMKPS
jgi:hypothetical protein